MRKMLLIAKEDPTWFFLIGLKNLGFEVKVAANDEEMLERLEEQRFDFLLLETYDISDQIISLIDRLQTLYPQMKIILICDSGYCPEGRNLKVNGFFTKPMDYEKFFKFLKGRIAK